MFSAVMSSGVPAAKAKSLPVTAPTTMTTNTLTSCPGPHNPDTTRSPCHACEDRVDGVATAGVAFGVGFRYT
jgi:hypothetical protein